MDAAIDRRGGFKSFRKSDPHQFISTVNRLATRFPSKVKTH